VEELTAREGEVLERLAEGSSTREISQQLSISINTTRNHIQNILQKLGVHSRLEAVIYAIDHDLLNHDD
jgi:DNA-binding NarL/FixJ family response regulator